MARLKPGAMLLHSAAVAVMTRAWFHLDKLPNNAWLEKEVGGHLQLLTIQGLLAAWATMSLSLLVDVVPSRRLTKIKRALFMIAMPLAAVISSTYWPLLLLSPHLILRAAQPEPTSSFSPSSSEVPELTLVRIPLTLDLSIHAVPTIALTLDFFLFEVKYSVKTARVGGAGVVALAAVLYGSWVEYCASYNGKFPYPYLTNSEFPVRVQIYAGSALFAYVVFQALNALHS